MKWEDLGQGLEGDTVMGPLGATLVRRCQCWDQTRLKFLPQIRGHLANLKVVQEISVPLCLCKTV